MKQQRVTDNLSQLLEVLPVGLRSQIETVCGVEDLLEIVIDLGRPAEARYADRVVEVSPEPVTHEDIQHVIDRVGSFGKDNRAGIERTLHRISAIRNRTGKIVGLTCRIGRAVFGTIDIIHDIVQSGKSILLLGRPGRGKTTKLREVARVLADEARRRVVIVDTSNEIAGDGDIAHPAIGRARRMQVAEPALQHAVMIEAVENHMPEVIIIDEIGTEQEAFAARTIAERGVQLVGTAHGNSLENLMMNPTLSDLVGGIQAVTLSDDEAKRRGTQKTVLERKAPPTFTVVIEIIDVDKLAVHHDVEQTVDRILRGQQPRPEIRVRNEDGVIEVVQRSDEPTADASPVDLGDDSDGPPGALAHRANASPEPTRRRNPRDGTRIFPYGINRSRLERAILETRAPATIARDVGAADAVIALKASYRREPPKMREGSARNLPTYVVRSNTYAQIASVVRDMFRGTALDRGDEEEATREAESAALQVAATGLPSELAPRNSYVRRLQHEVAVRMGMVSESVGDEPRRRVRISPA